MNLLRRLVGVPLFLVFNLLSINTYAQLNGGTSLLQFIGLSSDRRRPAIYTFVHIDESNASLDEEHILVWAEAWASAGWDPRVLTEVDASHHPQYESFVRKLSSSKLPEKGWDRFLRYLAMSSVTDGGYFTLPQVYPIHHSVNFFDGKALPNDGKFTMHDGLHLSLLSGSKDEWNRITSAIISDDENDVHDHVKRDTLVLSSMHKHDPKDIILEDSFVDIKYIMSIQQINTSDADRFCKILQNRKATKLATCQLCQGFFNHRKYLKALKSSLNNCKPTMHTFFELAFGKNAEKTLLTEVEEWKKAWQDAGWNTVVLTLDDAKRHPLFNEFNATMEKAEYHTDNYDRMCFFRWLAMASTPNGGWMSDYDTYPLGLYQKYDSGFNLPNNGAFTSNLHFVPNLVSGSKSEWNRMSELLLANYKEHTTTFWSDMFALDNILKAHPKAFFYSFDAIELSTIYSVPPPNLRQHRTDYGDRYMDKDAAQKFPFELKRFCSMTEGKLAVHFSHASCHRVGFCHNNRGPMLNKWLEVWKEQCLFHI